MISATQNIDNRDYLVAMPVMSNPQNVTRRRFRYDIETDEQQGDKATEIRLFSVRRPHMRAFHFAWLSFFIAFFGWFSIPPLLPTIKKQLNLTKYQIDTSNIVSVSSTIIGRVIVGPLCDRYGSRTVQAVLLTLGALPVAAASLVYDYNSFLVVRFLIGIVGCSFVACASWTAAMFSTRVVGSASALAAGWGNLGAGVTYLVTPLIFDVLNIYIGFSTELTWRTTLLFPAIFMAAVGISLYLYSDDCPQGNYRVLTRMHAMDMNDLKPKVDLWEATRTVMKLPATWVLIIQYGTSFGVEVITHNVLSLYYYEDFTKENCIDNGHHNCNLLTQTTAGLISSCFGLCVIFARALGGYASDWASRRYSMKGRLVVQFLAFAGQAFFLYIFSRATTLALSVPSLVAFAILVQMCTGTTYGIVPYVFPKYTGTVSGAVGAGGNLGALVWGFLFAYVGNRRDSFFWLSVCVGASAMLTFMMNIRLDYVVWSHHVGNDDKDNVRGSFELPEGTVLGDVSHGPSVYSNYAESYARSSIPQKSVNGEVSRNWTPQAQEHDQRMAPFFLLNEQGNGNGHRQ